MNRRSVIAAAVAALVLGAGCGGEEPEPTAVATATPTAAAPTPTPSPPPAPTPAPEAQRDCADVRALQGKPKRRPPETIEVLFYARVYRSEGRKVFYAELDGEPGEIFSRRDDAASYLVQNKGFHQIDAAGVENVEASAKLEGENGKVDVEVKALCRGKLVIRYALS